ncbi:MAG: hypothetical protein ACK5AO_02335 [bacterium]
MSNSFSSTHPRLAMLDLFGGTSLNTTLSLLREQQYMSFQDLCKIQEAGLERVFNIATSSTTFYKHAASYEALEVLTKDAIRTNFKDFISNSYTKKLYNKGTGGSTGIPLVYLTTADARSYLWAGIFLSWEAAGYKLGDRVAFIAGTSIVKSSIRHFAFYQIMNIDVYSAFTLDDFSIQQYIKRIQQSKTKFIYGYSSALNLIADYIKRSGSFDFPHLKSIVSTAEILTEVMRNNISSAFNVEVFNQYGCNEAGVSAFECEHKKMHLINTRSYFEIDGESNFISTDLVNEGFIMLKYLTGDRIRFSEEQQCLCGRNFPIIGDIIGRSFDVVKDTKNNMLHSSFFSILFRGDPFIRQFQIQYDNRDISIYLNVDPLRSEKTYYEKYVEMIKQRLCFDHYNLIINAPFISAANAKYRHVINTAI